MTGEFKIMIGGSEKNLLFNNFAHVELSKAFFERGHYVSNPSELIDRLLELSSENAALFMKAIIYAGIIGYDYTHSFKASMTQQQVGELIAKMPNSEIIPVWEKFLDAMGVNISDLLKNDKPEVDPEEEEGEEEEKKRQLT